MSHRPSSLRRLVAVLAVAVLATSCGLFGEGEKQAGQKTGGVLRTIWINFPNLDPQTISNGMWYAEQGLLEGLVHQNAKSTDVIPATADTWKKSDDGLTYTFHIRDSATWSNGDPVTAKDFEWTYKRLLNPKSGGAGVMLGNNSYQPTLSIKNDVEFLQGRIKNWADVGIKATDDDTLQFTLSRPNSAFLMGLTHPSMLPLNPKALKQYPKDWQKPERWVGNGPFNLDQWKLNSSIRITKNDKYWDKKHVYLSAVETQLVEASAQPATYRNKEVDVMLLDTPAMREFQADPEMAKAIKTIPATTTAYLATMHSKNKALQDIRVRKALSLALDRETVAKSTPGARPGGALPPNWLPGWSDDLATKTDIAEAKRLLAEAGYPNGKGLPTITLLAGLPQPILDAIVDQWKKDLGIKVKSDVVESGVYTEKRFAVHPEQYAGFYYGTFGMIQGTWDFIDNGLWGPTYMREFSVPPSVWAKYQKTQADAKLDPAAKNDRLEALLDKHASSETKRFADAVEQAGEQTDPAKQQQAYVDAAKLREQSYLILPVAWLDTNIAVRGTVKGLNLRKSFEFYYFKGVSIS